MNATIAALERLAVKQGVTLGNLTGSDLQVVLALASLCLSADATFLRRAPRPSQAESGLPNKSINASGAT